MHRAFTIRRAASILHQGGVVAYPTEGVYGLGCLPDASAALVRILQIKGRSATAGLILIAAAADQLADWIAPSATEYSRLCEPAAYPTTWIVTASPAANPLLTGGRETLAVRITSHPLAAALCRTADSALVSTSANRSGKPPALSSLAATLKLGKTVDYVLSGPLGNAGGPSEIRVAKDNRVIRHRS